MRKNDEIEKDFFHIYHLRRVQVIQPTVWANNIEEHLLSRVS